MLKQHNLQNLLDQQPALLLGIDLDLELLLLVKLSQLDLLVLRLMDWLVYGTVLVIRSDITLALMVYSGIRSVFH